MLFNEIKQSRLKETKEYILKSTTGGLMNNVKWYALFESIDSLRLNFSVKTLLSDDVKNASIIYELEDTSILFTDDGNFIEFIEIEKIEVDGSDEFESRLKNDNIEYYLINNRICVQGYKLTSK